MAHLVEHRKQMLRVERSANGQVIFRLIGRMDGENIRDLERVLRSESKDRPIVLDLKDVTLVNNDVVTFLARSEADGIMLQHCPAYVREWITKQNRS